MLIIGDVILLMHGFEAVPIQVNHKGGVVGWPIVQPKTRATVVRSTELQGGRVECVDRFMGGCREGKMKTCTRIGRGRNMFEREFILVLF